jgi:hypothetical protein
MNDFAEYRPRLVELNQLAKVGSWDVKIYTITNRATFESKRVLENAILNLPKWLARSRDLELSTYDQAFLIVHEGRDGVWTLINWWIGGEMLQSKTHFTNFDKPDEFNEVPKDGFMACVWELAVISFERAMWIDCVLKNSANPNLTGYSQKHLNQLV